MTITPSLTYTLNEERMLAPNALYVAQFGVPPTYSYVIQFPVSKDLLAKMDGLTCINRLRFVENKGGPKEKSGRDIFLTDNNVLISAEYYYNQREMADCSVLGGKDYDPKDWIDKLYKIRLRVSRKPIPNIQLMTPTLGGLKLTNVTMRAHKVNIGQHYNDDIGPTVKALEDGLKDPMQNGLVLLDGLPGTGKTNLVKWLTGRFHQRKMIFVPAGMVEALSSPGLIDLLLEHKGSVLFIEDAEDALMDRQYSGRAGVVSTLLQLTDGVLGDALKIMVIATCNAEKNKIDPALLRPGRLIAQYTFGKLSRYKSDSIRASLNIDQTGEEATLAELYANAPLKSIQKETRRIGFASPANRPVEPKVPPMPTPAERLREDEEDGLLALERLSSGETRITSEDVKEHLKLPA